MGQLNLQGGDINPCIVRDVFSHFLVILLRLIPKRFFPAGNVSERGVQTGLVRSSI